jgi:hypothetical protein
MDLYFGNNAFHFFVAIKSTIYLADVVMLSEFIIVQMHPGFNESLNAINADVSAIIFHKAYEVMHNMWG